MTREQRLEAVVKAGLMMRVFQKRYFRGERDLIDQCRQFEAEFDRLAAEAMRDEHQGELF